MTLTTLQEEIEEAIPDLFSMARGLTWNKISDNYKFILTEIKDTEENFHVQRRLIKNDFKNTFSDPAQVSRKKCPGTCVRSHSLGPVKVRNSK